MAMPLSDLVAPDHTAVLTQECQKGVLSAQSLRRDLYDHALAHGILDHMGQVVSAGRAAGCDVVHAIAAHRADLRGASHNARLFTSIAKHGLLQLVGTPLVEVIDEIPTAPDDLFSVRLHGFSPIAGTDVDALLRNLGVRTIVIIGVSTNLGVTNAAFDAVNLGYQVVVVRDAIIGLPADYSELVIEHTLQLIATVVTTDELLEAWRT